MIFALYIHYKEKMMQIDNDDQLETTSAKKLKYDSAKEICIIEPFYGGSHKQLIDLIESELKSLDKGYDLYTLSDKKWHWRARVSALNFSSVIKRDHNYKYITLLYLSNFCC